MRKLVSKKQRNDGMRLRKGKCNASQGIRFLNAVEDAVTSVRINPLICNKPDRLGRRKYRIGKFPSLLIYKVRESRVYILAIAHTSYSQVIGSQETHNESGYARLALV